MISMMFVIQIGYGMLGRECNCSKSSTNELQIMDDIIAIYNEIDPDNVTTYMLY